MVKVYRLALTLTFGALGAPACSYSCAPDALVVRGDFTVVVRHAGAGLAGADIMIEPQRDDGRNRLSGVTNQEGTFSVRRLKAGIYWLSANRWGINVFSGCFRVTRSPFVRKATIEVTWRTEPLEVRQLAGRLIGLRPDPTRSPLAEYLHHKIETQPIVHATVTLFSVTEGAVATATTDETGVFTLPPHLAGVFVLRVEGGDSGVSYEATNLVVRVATEASRPMLVLRRPVMGLCGSTQLVPI